MMTCAECRGKLAAWSAGTLSEADARAVEAHAAECASCGTLLESTSRVPVLPQAIDPPPALRASVLQAVSRRRARARWLRTGMIAAGIAAVALFAIMTRPARKSASDFPGAGRELLARAHARPEFAELDAAEHDLEAAIRDHPGDAELAAALARVRRQRDALQHLVVTVNQ